MWVSFCKTPKITKVWRVLFCNPPKCERFRFSSPQKSPKCDGFCFASPQSVTGFVLQAPKNVTGFVLQAPKTWRVFFCKPPKRDGFFFLQAPKVWRVFFLRVFQVWRVFVPENNHLRLAWILPKMWREFPASSHDLLLSERFSHGWSGTALNFGKTGCPKSPGFAIRIPHFQSGFGCWAPSQILTGFGLNSGGPLKKPKKKNWSVKCLQVEFNAVISASRNLLFAAKIPTRKHPIQVLEVGNFHRSGQLRPEPEPQAHCVNQVLVLIQRELARFLARNVPYKENY